MGSRLLGLWIAQEGVEPRRVLEGDHYPVGWSPDGSTVFAFEPAESRLTGVEAATGRLALQMTLPYILDAIDLDMARDGLGVIAAVREAPADVIVVDLVGPG